MSQKIKKGLLLIMSIVMLAPAVRGLAATPKQEALKAYSRWLSNANVQVMPKNEDIYLLDGWTKYTRPTPASKTLFAIAYINNDSIPELIVCNDNKEFYSVLTYRNGKIVRASSSYRSRSAISRRERGSSGTSSRSTEPLTGRLPS